MQNPYHTYLLQRLEAMTPRERRIADESVARWVCTLFRRRRRKAVPPQVPQPRAASQCYVAGAPETVSTR